MSQQLKRPEPDDPVIDESPRASKRLKASPATPIEASVDDLPALLAQRLRKNIENIPPSLVIEASLMFSKMSLTTLLSAVLAENLEREYIALVTGMIARLNQLKDLLSAAHDAALKPTKKPMPVPSAFAQPSGWVPAQETPDAILCLRPRNKQDLPLIALHEAFLYFVNESKKPLPATEVAALKAAFQLCNTMPEHYEKESSRRDAFNAALGPLISSEAWHSGFGLEPEPGNSGWIDGALDGKLAAYALLREDKAEPGANGDPYLQVSRGFQAFVGWKRSQGSDQGKPGVAKFLLTLAGPMLTIAGGFYDGKSTIVEPLTPSMIMLPDHNIEGRPMVIAQCLFALKNALDLIRIPPEQPVIAATPRIYSSVLSGGETPVEIPISFVKPLPHLGSLMFSATAIVGNNAKKCLVKLVYGHYGAEVHRLLAHDGLAPEFVGIQTKSGAPIAIAMEYLEPYSPGLKGWATLFSFSEQLVALGALDSLALVVHKIIGKLEQANLVHGDLRANNLMVHVNADGTVSDGEKLRVKVIDFDWGGQSGQVTYPRYRNDQLWWPAGVGEDIAVGHDRVLVEHWWKIMFPKQAFPPLSDLGSLRPSFPASAMQPRTSK